MLVLSLALNSNLELTKVIKNTGKGRSGVAIHFLDVARSSASKFDYLQIQLIEKVSVQNDDNIEKVLWERENTGKRSYLR